MTETEKEAERELRMEKMRIAARECRLRKKSNVKTLEAKVQAYCKKDRANKALIASLQEEVRRLQFDLEHAGQQLQATPDCKEEAGYRGRPEQQLPQPQRPQYPEHYQHQQFDAGEP